MDSAREDVLTYLDYPNVNGGWKSGHDGGVKSSH
jgi:hypothetical protein